MRFSQKLLAEGVGTAFLLAAIVGSGIMGERLAAGNTAIALLANSLATGAVLIALILALSPVSGGHFNPAVTLASALDGEIRWSHAGGYVVAQIAGSFVGVAIAHVMFGQTFFSTSLHIRSGAAQAFSEFVATLGLLTVIAGCARFRGKTVAFAVGAYITAAYWFTGSTSFANPAVTLARSATNTFAGIRPRDVPGFLAAQLAAVAVAVALDRLLFRPPAGTPFEKRGM